MTRVLSAIFFGTFLMDAQTPAPAWPPAMEDNPVLTYMLFNELEGRFTGPGATFRWDGEGWIGNSENKLWLKTEGTLTSGKLSDGDHEALYDRPIPRIRYLDWQAGVRVDADSGPARTWGAIGIEGLAPYFFDIEPTFYFRAGHVAGRLNGSYNLYLTQRLILQPQAELNFYGSPDRGRRIGTGVSDLDSGLRLGYQISRKFAPYVGGTYSSTFGATAAYARQANEAVRDFRFVFGIWVWR